MAKASVKGIYKDTNGTWYIKHQGTTKRGFTTQKEAVQFKADLIAKQQNFKANLTFEIVAEDYLKYKKTRVKHATYTSYEEMINNHILPSIKKATKVSDFTKYDVRKFQEVIGKKDLSSAFKNMILSRLKALFKHAIKFFDMQDDPTIVLDTFKKSYDKIVEENENDKVLSPTEFYTLMNHIESDRYKALLTFLYNTGLRVGEANALRWSDINDGYINVKYNTTRAPKESKDRCMLTSPKTPSSVRKIALGEKLREYMEEYKRKESEVYGFNEEWFVFCRNKLSWYVNANAVMKKAIKKAGVPDISLHGLRHSHATNLIYGGMPIAEVSKRLGHANIGITMSTYAHLFKEKGNKSDELLDSFFSKSSQQLA